MYELLNSKITVSLPKVNAYRMLLGKEYHWLTVSECLHLNYLYAVGSSVSLPAQFVKQRHAITDAWA